MRERDREASIQSINAAREAVSLITDDPTQQHLLVLLAIRSFIRSASVLRPPTYLSASSSTDLVVLRQCLLSLFHVYVVSNGPNADPMEGETTVLHDMTETSDAQRWQIRRRGYLRCMPIETHPGDSIPSGETIAIIPESHIDAFRGLALTINLVKVNRALITSTEVADKFRLWGNIAVNIPDNLELSGEPANLPETEQPRHIPTTMLRAYLSLLGIANRLEEALGVTGFSSATISIMREADRDYKLHMSPEIRRRLLAQMRIGITSRVVFPAERGRLNRIWRTCIVISEEGKLKMEEQSHEL